MTYREIINKYKPICLEKKLEIEAVKLLILELFNLDAATFLSKYDEKLNNETIKILENAINKYVYDFIPVQHILGYAYFYGNKLTVSSDVLIPRSETEELVSYTIQYYNEMFKGKKVSLVDIGTGSGAISIALAKEEKNMYVTATDISCKALTVARDNAINNNVNIEFYQGDLLEPLIVNNLKFDILVSNPPYIDKVEDVDPLVLKNEPHLALFADNNGIECYDKILKDAHKILNHPSVILFEHGYNQKHLMVNLANKYYPNSICKVLKDLNGNDRFTIIINK